MLRKILMVLLPVIALIAGAIGGDFLKGSPDPAEASEGDATETDNPATTEGGQASEKKTTKAGSSKAEPSETAYFPFPTQFFVPIMQNGDTYATMILTLTLEMPKTSQEKVHANEHRLRDALLRTLMIHANTGGFSGNYTSDAPMDRLRGALLKAATETVGPDVSGVLVEDIARQLQ